MRVLYIIDCLQSYIRSPEGCMGVLERKYGTKLMLDGQVCRVVESTVFEIASGSLGFLVSLLSRHALSEPRVYEILVSNRFDIDTLREPPLSSINLLSTELWFLLLAALPGFSPNDALLLWLKRWNRTAWILVKMFIDIALGIGSTSVSRTCRTVRSLFEEVVYEYSSTLRVFYSQNRAVCKLGYEVRWENTLLEETCSLNLFWSGWNLVTWMWIWHGLIRRLLQVK